MRGVGQPDRVHVGALLTQLERESKKDPRPSRAAGHEGRSAVSVVHNCSRSRPADTPRRDRLDGAGRRGPRGRLPDRCLMIPWRVPIL
jgi:hypothetical protein